MRDVFVERLVFVVFDRAARTCPECGCGVDRLKLLGLRCRLSILLGCSLFLHAYWNSDMVGVLAHYGAQPETVDKFERVALEMQRHLGAAGSIRILDRKLVLAG